MSRNDHHLKVLKATLEICCLGTDCFALRAAGVLTACAKASRNVFLSKTSVSSVDVSHRDHRLHCV